MPQKDQLDFQQVNNDLISLVQQAELAILAIDNLQALQQEKAHYLGKKGLLTEYMKLIGRLPNDQKPRLGESVNKAKQRLAEVIKQHSDKLQANALQQKLEREKIDVTLPGRGQNAGNLHPVTQVKLLAEKFFSQLGFELIEGREIENDFYNFTALNIPDNHPAREMHDTFYTDNGLLLRTHTSNMQIHTMQNKKPPLRAVSMGRTYRCDSDITHSPMFHQLEGFMVDEGITFAHLKGILQEFLQFIFSKKLKVRFRASYFPFTEPSAEVDVQCVKCTGKGCRICSHSGWLEILGCGMIHPNVFAHVGIDSEKYTGFAFGMGLERIAMLRYGIDDIRVLFDNDVRFLQQFHQGGLL